MNCLPFIKKVVNLRTVETHSPSELNKVFTSEKRKQRNSTDSGFSSVVESHSTSGFDESTAISSRSASLNSSVDSSSINSAEYDPDQGHYIMDSFYLQGGQPNKYFDQMSGVGQSCDESTVFSLSNQTDIAIHLSVDDFLGISIVGENFSNGESSLFVGSVLPGGAVSRDGRIQPGDLILAVNGESLEGKSSQQAVTTLRQTVRATRTLVLTVVGSWEEESVYSDRSCVRPIDPLLWLTHNSLIDQSQGPNLSQQSRYRNLKSQTSIVSSSLSSSMPSTAARFRSRFQQQALPLETPTDIIANRLRLHIVARNTNRQVEDGGQNKSTISINGVELQMWLYKNMRGFKDLAEVENYATHMIDTNYLIPASSYFLAAGSHHTSHNSSHSSAEFNRRETYIVNTRPVSVTSRPVNSVRSTTPIWSMNSSPDRQKSNAPLTVWEETPSHRSSSLHNQIHLCSVGHSVSRF